MAAGLSIKKDDVDTLRRRLNELCELTEDDFVEKVIIDVPMPFSYITEDLINQFSLLEPFGNGNPKPVFAQKDVSIRFAKLVGERKNVLKLKLADQNGFAIDAVYFGDMDHIRSQLGDDFENNKMIQSKKISALYFPDINEYNGIRSIQLRILDINVQKG